PFQLDFEPVIVKVCALSLTSSGTLIGSSSSPREIVPLRSCSASCASRSAASARVRFVRILSFPISGPAFDALLPLTRTRSPRACLQRIVNQPQQRYVTDNDGGSRRRAVGRTVVGEEQRAQPLVLGLVLASLSLIARAAVISRHENDNRLLELV